MLHGPHRARRSGARVRGAAGPRDLRRVPDPTLLARRTVPSPDPLSLIWTTTPWTIPSNLAIAVHPDETYSWVESRAAGTTWSPSSSCRRVADDSAGRTGSAVPSCPAGRSRAPSTRTPCRRSAGASSLPRKTRARSASSSATTSPWTRAPDSCTPPPATAKTTSSPGSGRSCRSSRPSMRPDGSRRSRSTGAEGPRRESGDRRRPQGRRRPCRIRPEVPPRVPALLALQEPRHLSGDDPVVRPSRRREDRRPARRARRDRPREVDPALGRGAHRRHGREPARVGGLAPAALGLADHAALRHARRRARRGLSVERLAGGAAEVLRAPRRDLPRGRRRRLVRAAGRRLPAGGRRPPRVRPRRLSDGDRHPRRVVRLRRLAHRRAALGRVARARESGSGSGRIARPISTSRDTTSIAAGSSRRF